jgi:carbonic anhydrase
LLNGTGMKPKDPLVIVLAGQMIVLVAAVAFMALRSTAEAPVKKPAKVEVADEEPAPRLKLTPPPVPRADDADGGEWEGFPGKKEGEKAEAPVKKPGPHDGKKEPEKHAAKEPAEAPKKEEPTREAPKEVKSATFEDVVSNLVAGNARFVDGASRQRDVVALRESLGETERADAVVVSCTDSRVVPELVFDQPLGTFAVVRVSGAQFDDSSVKAVEDAVKRLHAKVVIVMGHLGCHHVEQALSRAGKKGVARPVTLTNALGGLKTAFEGDALDEAAAVASVSFSTRDLRRRSKVLAKAEDVPTLRVIYAPKTGAVRWLDAEQEAPAPEAAPRTGRR